MVNAARSALVVGGAAFLAWCWWTERGAAQRRAKEWLISRSADVIATHGRVVDSLTAIHLVKSRNFDMAARLHLHDRRLLR
jgi:hypothetical protein